MSRIITYNIPDARYSTENTLGKTSTVEFFGPDILVVWVINNEHVTRIVDSFPKDEVPDRPTPLNYTPVEIDTRESDENAVRVALIYGGIAEQRQLEVVIPSDALPNKIIADPTDIREVYSRPKALEDCIDLETGEWAPLAFRTGNTTERTDESIKNIRNGLLWPSDSKIADDMPAGLKQEWATFRQTLRDLPVIAADIPNELIQMPLAPDEDDGFSNNDDVTVISPDQRTEDDQWAVDNQLPTNIT